MDDDIIDWLYDYSGQVDDCEINGRLTFVASRLEWQQAEIERLRAAANRTLNAFFCCEGLDNTDLMDAFSEWAVLMDHAAMPEARAWIAKWEARRG